MPEEVVRPKRWPKRLKIAGTVLALLAAPVLTISPALCLVLAAPGILLFVAGRMAE